MSNFALLMLDGAGSGGSRWRNRAKKKKNKVNTTKNTTTFLPFRRLTGNLLLQGCCGLADSARGISPRLVHQTTPHTNPATRPRAIVAHSTLQSETEVGGQTYGPASSNRSVASAQDRPMRSISHRPANLINNLF